MPTTDTPRPSRRLYILNSDEIAALYARPRFSDEERAQFFALSAEEQTLLAHWHTFPSRITFILQLGYFKASQQFFAFELPDMADDVQWIQHVYFPNQPSITKLAAKGTRLKHQTQILQLHNYRLCTTHERQLLQEYAQHAVRLSSKPRFILRQLQHFLADKRIVTPGYTSLQDLISNTLLVENQRLGRLINNALTVSDREALQKLLTNPDGLYELTRLKREPKSFGETQMMREIQRGEQLAPLNNIAERVLPTLDISNESIKYYASLVSYYSVYQLRRIASETTFLYLLCFAHHRYRQLHDNLINCLTYRVYEYNEDARTIAKDRIAQFRQAEAANLAKAGELLLLFISDRVPDDMRFGEVVQTFAFNIADEDGIRQLARSLIGQATIDETAWQWAYLDERSMEFKRRLRPILRTVTFQALSDDMPLLNAVRFVQDAFHNRTILRQLPADDFPLDFVPTHQLRYLYKVTEGKKQLDADRYEFFVYRQLRHALVAGDLFCQHSVRFRSFEDDLINDDQWQQRDELLDQVGLSDLKQPADEWLDAVEKQLEQRISTVNQRIASGDNNHFKKEGGGRWKLPYTRANLPIDHPFFAQLPHVDVQTLLHDVHRRTGFLHKFDHALHRSGQRDRDAAALVAALVAWGTNMGLGRMGELSDVPYTTLAALSNNYIRLETLRTANDAVVDATAALPIFRLYDIGGSVHSSSDGQKFETRLPTINARHSSKYFGLGKGIVVYTLVANHLPLNAQVIGAHESESHYVFDLLVNNNTHVKPTTHSTDTHGANHVNFALLHLFGYQFAPRYRDLHDKVNSSLYGFQHPTQYDEAFVLKPIRKISRRLITSEWDNMQRIVLSLALKTTTQAIIVGKLSSYARKNRTKRALWEMDNIFRSLYLLDYIDSLSLRRNVQRALGRGEAYHQLQRAVSYANFGLLRFKTEHEQQLWSECARLIANCVIHYNALILSGLLAAKQRVDDNVQIERLARVSPVAWQHVNFQGRYTFLDLPQPLDIDELVEKLARHPIGIIPTLD